MIGILFKYANDTVEVRITGTEVIFRTSQLAQFADIDGIKLDKNGVIKEFPDLKDEKDWQKEARKRFKKKMRDLNDEKERAEYLIKDLTKHGYQPMYLQRQGFRPIKL
jgi:hypothetical protein